MKWHKLLARQAEKHLGQEWEHHPAMQAFLEAVNNSYLAYEKDLFLSEHAARLTEEEYIRINDRLTEEVRIKEAGLKSVHQLLHQMDHTGDCPDKGSFSDDLVEALDYINQNISLQMQREEQLKRLSLVASLNENGVIFTSPEGFITWANEGFCRLTGYPMEEVIGKTPLEICKGPLSDKMILSSMVDSFRAGKTFNVEVVHYKKDGSWFWGKTKGQAVTDGNGKVTQYFAMTEDITQSKWQQELVRKNEEKYRSIISNMNLGLLEVDLDGNIQFANQSFCEMSGYEPEELLGRNAAKVFIHPESHILIEGKDAMRLNGISDAYEIEAAARHGEQRWWLISGAPRFNDQGEVVGSIGIHLDITEQKKLQQELIEARELAEDSARSKEAFLANMSHEIRTPMNAILGMSSQLRKTPLSTKQKIFLDTIHSAADNLLVIINDILDISKIEAGKLSVENIGFRVKELLEKVVGVMRHKADEKGLHLSYRIDPAVPEVLTGDPYRINQVILNLVSNAIKFTEHGSVTVSCFPSEGQGETVIAFEVTDTGIGMDQSFLENIFQKFKQEDNTTARKYGGTGLGMSISKHLAELMGGNIRVKSEKKVGTEVFVSLPLPAGTVADIPVEQPLLFDAGELKGKRILLVEDNEMNRLVATTTLANYSVHITEACNGEEAIRLVQQQEFDLILMDIQMPVMDGLEASRIIRQSIDQQVPIIALTANAIRGENEKCMAVGMNGYISKPFEEEELIEMMAHWLGREKKVCNEKQEAAPEPLYHLDRLQVIAQNNEAFLQKIIHLFLEETPRTMTAMEAAYEAGDFPTLKALAHKYKPTIDNFGITSLADNVRTIEKLALANKPDPQLESLLHTFRTVLQKVVSQLETEVAQ